MRRWVHLLQRRLLSGSVDNERIYQSTTLVLKPWLRGRATRYSGEFAFPKTEHSPARNLNSVPPFLRMVLPLIDAFAADVDVESLFLLACRSG
jgi:hypothetical protein